LNVQKGGGGRKDSGRAIKKVSGLAKKRIGNLSNAVRRGGQDGS